MADDQREAPGRPPLVNAAVVGGLVTVSGAAIGFLQLDTVDPEVVVGVLVAVGLVVLVLLGVLLYGFLRRNQQDFSDEYRSELRAERERRRAAEVDADELRRARREAEDAVRRLQAELDHCRGGAP